MDQVVRSKQNDAAAEVGPKARPPVVRPWLVLAHRWLGLTIAIVLLVAGLTGAVLPFSADLNHMASPKLWAAAPPTPGAPLLSGIALMHKVEQQTGGVVRFMPLQLDPHFAQAVFVGARPGGPSLGYEEVIADPYTGAIRQKTVYGRLSDGPVNLVPFLMELHYELAAGPTGYLLFGCAALIWVFVSLIGFYLTLPARSARAAARASWLQRWAPAWQMRPKAGALPFTFDLHRVGGLWVWPVMLVFAWSAVAFNLPQVHDPVHRALGARGLFTAPRNVDPADGTVMSPEAAVQRGRVLMDEQARQRGFTVEGGWALSLNPSAHTMGYYARTSLDRPIEKQGSTAVWFDQVDGRFLELQAPFGRTAADSFDKWVQVLHRADVFGLPYRLFVSLFGLLVASSAATGVILWTRRQMRRFA